MREFPWCNYEIREVGSVFGAQKRKCVVVSPFEGMGLRGLWWRFFKRLIKFYSDLVKSSNMITSISFTFLRFLSFVMNATASLYTAVTI